jgi:undecaprenyl-diphosphatase
MALLARYPALFQTALFIASTEIGVLFGDVRLLVEGIVKYFPR